MWNGTLRVILNLYKLKRVYYCIEIISNICNVRLLTFCCCFIIVTAASSNDDGIGKTKLNFKYTMERDGKRHGVIMQLSPQEFYKLLHEMDRVKGNLQSLTGGSNAAA